MSAPDRAAAKRKLKAAALKLRYLPRVFSIISRASRGWSLAWLFIIVLQGILPVAVVFITRALIDSVVSGIERGGGIPTFYEVLWPAGLLGGILLLSEVVGIALRLARENITELVKDALAALIHDKSTAVDIAFYDSPDYYDRLHRAKNEARYRPDQLMESFGSTIQSGVTLAAMAGVLLKFNFWFPLILLVSTAPALLVVLRHAMAQHLFRLRNTEDERRAWYYDYEMTSGKSASEMRLFHLADYFKEKYIRTRSRLRKERLSLIRRRSALELAVAVIALSAAAGCLGVMGWRALNGTVTLGELALFYLAFTKGQQMMRALLGNAGGIYRNLLFIGDLFEFLDLTPSITAPEGPVSPATSLKDGIVFDNVSFSYPRNDRPILTDFSLTLPAGRVSAVVGPNGSGKSTLVRLLGRFYDPTAGAIMLDGTDLRAFDPSDIRRMLTAVFQDPVHYSAAASTNIAFGDLRSSPGPDRLADAVSAAGAGPVIGKLRRGMDTRLGKWFEGGTELSGGEWQRLALARALLRPAPIVLLDEPTSAMDSWSETEWMGRLGETLSKRTVLIITHRFTTAMHADLIFVMDDGKIVESGTHDALVAGIGPYAEAWRRQIKKRG